MYRAQGLRADRVRKLFLSLEEASCLSGSLAFPQLPGRPCRLDSMGLRPYTTLHPLLPSLPCSVGYPDIFLPTRSEALRFQPTKEQSWRTDMALSLLGPRTSLVTIGGQLAKNKMLPALGPHLPLSTSAQSLMVI